MSDLIKNSLGSFFKKKIVDTNDPSETEKKEIAAEDELSKSERYRRNVAKFVE